METFTEEQFLTWIASYLWPFCRIGALLLSAPVFGAQFISPRVRIVLATAITIIIAPLLPEPPAVEIFSLASLLIVVQQVVIGLAMGLVLQVVFHVCVLAGQMIAMKMGLGFASMNDPANGITVTVVSQFYLMLTTLLFLSLNGHLIVIDILVQSFYSLEVGVQGISVDGFLRIVELASWMFRSALIIVLPVITSILIVNIAFGVMNRSAPQMNVFTVGFPITLIFGLLLIWFSLTSFLPVYQSFLEEGFAALKTLLNLN